MKNSGKKLPNSLFEFLYRYGADSLILEKKKDDDIFGDEEKEDEDTDSEKPDENENETSDSEETPEELPDDFADSGSDDLNPEEDQKEPEELEPEDTNTTSAEEKMKDQDSLDRALTDVFMDFEKLSLVHENKNRKRLSLRILLENTEEAGKANIDIDKFAEETARLIKNYDNLLDMEAIIFNKAKEFLVDKGYDKALIDKFKRLLSDRHDLDFFEDDEVSTAPTAVGARGGSSGGIM